MMNEYCLCDKQNKIDYWHMFYHAHSAGLLHSKTFDQCSDTGGEVIFKKLRPRANVYDLIFCRS